MITCAGLALHSIANETMTKINQWMIEQIHYCLDRSYDNYTSTRYNTTIAACGSGVRHCPGYNRWIEVRFDGVTLAEIHPFTSQLIIRHCDRLLHSSRINAIFREFADHFRVEQRDNQTVTVDRHSIWREPEILPLVPGWHTRIGVC